MAGSVGPAGMHAWGAAQHGNPAGQGTGNEANGRSIDAETAALPSDGIVSLPGYIDAEVSVTEGGLSSASQHHLRSNFLESSTGVPLKRMRRDTTGTERPENRPSLLSGKSRSPKVGSLAKAVMFQAATEHKGHQVASFGHLGTFEDERRRRESLDIKMHRQITNFRRIATKTASLDPNVGITSTRCLRRAKGVVSVDLLEDEERMEDLRKEYAWRRYPEPIEFGRLAMALVGIVFPVYGVAFAYRYQHWLFAVGFYALATIYWGYIAVYLLSRRPTSNKSVKAFVYQEGLVHSRMQEAYVWTWLCFVVVLLSNLGILFSTFFKYQDEQHFYGSRVVLWAMQAPVNLPLILGYDALTCTSEFKEAAMHKGYPGMAHLHDGYWLRVAILTISGGILMSLWLTICGPSSLLKYHFSWDFYLVYAAAISALVMQVFALPKFARAVSKQERSWSMLLDSSTEEGVEMLRSHSVSMQLSRPIVVLSRISSAASSIRDGVSGLTSGFTNSKKKKRKSWVSKFSIKSLLISNDDEHPPDDIPAIPILSPEQAPQERSQRRVTLAIPSVEDLEAGDIEEGTCGMSSEGSFVAEQDLSAPSIVLSLQKSLKHVDLMAGPRRFAALLTPGDSDRGGNPERSIFSSIPSASWTRNKNEASTLRACSKNFLCLLITNCRTAVSIMGKQWRFMAASSPDKFIFASGCVLPGIFIWPVGGWTFEDNYFSVVFKACALLLGLAAVTYSLLMSNRSSEEMILLAAQDNQNIGAGQVYSTASILNSMLSGKPLQPGAVATEERIREAAAISCRWNTLCSWPMLVKEGKGTRECWIMVQRTQLFRAALEARRHRCKWFWMDTLSIPQKNPGDSEELRRLKAGASQRLITTMTSVYATCKRVIVIETSLPDSPEDQNAYCRRLWTLQECVLNRNLSEVPLESEIKSLDKREPRAHLTGAGPGDAWLADPGLTNLGTYEWVLHGEEKAAAAKAEPRALEYLRFVETRYGSNSADKAVALGQIFFRLLFENTQVSCNFIQHLACNLLEGWEGDGTLENSTLVLIDNDGWNPHCMAGSADVRRLMAGKPGSLEAGNPVTWTLLVVSPGNSVNASDCWSLVEEGQPRGGHQVQGNDEAIPPAAHSKTNGCVDANPDPGETWHLCWMALSGRIVPCAMQKLRTVQGDLVLRRLRTCTRDEKDLLDTADLDEHKVHWA